MFLIFFVPSFTFLLGRFRSDVIDKFLNGLGITSQNIISFLIQYWYFSPIAVLTAYFLIAAIQAFFERNWDDVLFENINPSGLSFPHIRIKIENTNDDYLKNCVAKLEALELVNDFRENKYFYDSETNVLPVNLAWFFNGKEEYNQIDIPRSGKASISVAVSEPLEKDAHAVFCTNIKGGSPIISMHAGEYRAKINVYAELGDNPLSPIVLDKTIYFQDGRLFIKDFVASNTATQQSVHLTGGILRRFRVFFKPRKNPAPKQNLRPPTRK